MEKMEIEKVKREVENPIYNDNDRVRDGDRDRDDGSEEETTSIKHLTDIIGEFGKWQMWLTLFLFFIKLVSAMNNMGFTFHAYKVDFWCDDVPQDYQNKTNDMKCFKFANRSEKCTKWNYDSSLFQETIITQFDLVCDRSYYASVTQSAFMFGYIFSGILLAYMSDKYGRRPIAWLSMILELIATLCTAMASNYWIYLISRFILGFAATGEWMALEILLMESLGPTSRTTYFLLPHIGWSLGYAVLPWIALWLRSFRLMLLLNSGISFTLIICFYWLDESPRWQITKRQFSKAEKTIKKAMQMNEKSMEKFDEKMEQLKRCIIEDNNQEAKQTNKSIIDLFKTPNLRKYSITLSVMFPSIALIYYGISYNIGNYGGNFFVTFSLGGLVELISLLINITSLRYFGRRTLASVVFAVNSLACLIMAFVSEPISRVSFALIAKVANIGQYQFMNYIMMETFPTELRNTVHGLTKISARVGAIIAPFIKDITEATSLAFIMIIYSIIAVINALLVLIFPETKGKEMPNTVRDAERKKKKKKVKNETNCEYEMANNHHVTV